MTPPRDKIINGKKFRHVISPRTKVKANEIAETIRRFGGNARIFFEPNKKYHTRRYHVYKQEK